MDERYNNPETAWHAERGEITFDYGEIERRLEAINEEVVCLSGGLANDIPVYIPRSDSGICVSMVFRRNLAAECFRCGQVSMTVSMISTKRSPRSQLLFVGVTFGSSRKVHRCARCSYNGCTCRAQPYRTRAAEAIPLADGRGEDFV